MIVGEKEGMWDRTGNFGIKWSIVGENRSLCVTR